MARNLEHNDVLTAFLDRGSRFEGTLSFQGAVRIDGVFRGDIVSGNSLTLGEQADVEGTITVEEVIISGRFSGSIQASRRLAINSSANVQGEVATPSINIDEGAVFNGTVSMGKISQPEDTRTDAEAMTESIAKSKGLS